MNRQAYFVPGALLLLLPLLALAADPNISGVWKASFSTEVGEQNYTFEFKVTGTDLRGRAKSANGDTELTNGKVTAGTVSFVERITYEGRSLEIEYTGKVVSADEIQFTRLINKQFTERLVARRVK
jgi:hypothetical protein